MGQELQSGPGDWLVSVDGAGLELLMEGIGKPEAQFLAHRPRPKA
jgi:hypothetical protein